MKGSREVRAPHGSELSCKGWPQEAALRMLMNNLDPDVAERPDDLVVYGGTGRAARSWEAFDAIVARAARPRGRRDAARAVGQAGRRVAHARVGAARADRELQPRPGVGDVGRVPAPRGARADDVRADDRGLVDLHRHPGHRAGHVRVLRRDRAPPARRHAGRHDHAHRRARRDGRRAAAGGDDERRRGLCVEVDPRAHPAAARDALPRRGGRRARRRGRALRAARRRRRGRCSVGLLGNAAEVVPRAARGRLRGRHRHRPDERPRSARRLRPERHDARGGRASCARATPRSTCAASRAAMAAHCAAMVGFQDRGRRGLRLRQQPARARPSSAASSARSTTRASCPPTCGRCSARARARSAGSRCRAIPRTSPRPTARCSRSSPTTSALAPLDPAGRASGSRSRACRRASAGSATASARGSGCASTSWCARGKLSAPIVIGRDHLDSGSVASPYRETEAMADGSDAIADWPLLNALVNTAAGASWVSIHHGGGVGIGRSIHAGMVCVADGTRPRRREARARADRRPGHGRDPPRRRGLRPRRRGGRGARGAGPDAGTERPRDRAGRPPRPARARPRGRPRGAALARGPAADRRHDRDEARRQRRGAGRQPGA